ncbi:MAG: hypothetical protein RMJ16_00780 [Thermoguttaceae bacterium]|nr:hypothetical protein [Thermoguttaceae bacterium]
MSVGSLSRRTVIVRLLLPFISLAPLRASFGQTELQSLQVVPADTGVYQACSGLGDLVADVSTSRAITRLKELKVVNVLTRLLKEQWQRAAGPDIPEELKSQMENPFVQEGLRLLAEMHSQEFFLAGDNSWSHVQRVLRQPGNAARLAMTLLAARLAEAGQSELDSEALREKLTDLIIHTYLVQQEEKVQVPRLLMGWRVKNVERAQLFVNMVRGFISMAAMGVSELAGRVQSIERAGGEFTVLHISGKDIPWEEMFQRIREARQEEMLEFLPQELEEQEEALPSPETEDSPKWVTFLAEKLRKLELYAALGMRDEWILLGFGPDLKFLDIPAEDAQLAGREEVAEALRRINGRVLSFSYYSQEIVNSSRLSLVEPAELAARALREWEEKEPEIPAQVRDRVIADLQRLADFAKKLETKSAAMADVLYRTNRGLEEILLTWDTPASSKALPLELLARIGPTPIAGLVIRSPSEANLILMQDILGWVIQEFAASVAAGLLQQEGGPDEPSNARLRNFMDRMWMCTRDADRVIREYFVPALADSETAWVLDAKLQAQEVIPGLPEVKQPLPLPEFALIIRLNDPESFKEGLKRTRELAKELTLILQDYPDLTETLPSEELGPLECECEMWDSGYLCKLILPGELGKLVPPPVAVLAQDLFVLSNSSAQAERLAQGQKLEAVGLIEDVSAPRSAAGFVHFGRLWMALRPWAEALAQPALYTEDLPQPETEELLSAFREDLDSLVAILQCIRSLTWEVVEESQGLRVMRAALEVEDLSP